MAEASWSEGLTLEQVQRGTNTASATGIVHAGLAGGPWSATSIRRTSIRLEPASAYWATYRVRVERRAHAGKAAPEQRKVTLVARACFHLADWERYAARLRDHYGEAPCRPFETGTGPHLVDDHQVAWWFYPVDPHLTTLAAAHDPREVRRLLAPRYSAKSPPAKIRVESVRYLPEISAALRYRVVDRPGAPERIVYGKLYNSGRGGELHETMQRLFEASQRHPELLRVVEPYLYDEDLDLHLEREAPGEPIEGDRLDPRFLPAAVAAANALAVFHELTDVGSANELTLEAELERLADVVHEMLLVHPAAGRLLRDLLVQVGVRLPKLAPEARVLTHGDMKYDQFLEDDGRFTLVDFEEIGWSETSWDLGKWCAHVVPAMPESWEDSEAAEQARTIFLARYRELRPQAALRRFPVYEAVHTANRAMVQMWGQEEGWEISAESLLTLAMERLRTVPP